MNSERGNIDGKKKANCEQFKFGPICVYHMSEGIETD